MNLARITAGLVATAMAMTVTACGTNHAATPAKITTPAATTTVQTPTSDAATGSETVAPPTATKPAAAAAAQQSADLAAVQNDLAGIDAGNNQANQDLNAGDSARAQNDGN